MSISLILASSSPYRRDLLSRFGLPFKSISPDIDETALTNEDANDLVSRLSLQKANAVAESHPDCFVIGSDQVADLEGRILTKPGSIDNAVQQLQNCSGKKVRFFTGLALINKSHGFERAAVCIFDVYFRKLSDTEIKNYIEREQPLDCAGSFKMEGLGITLFEKLAGDDPNTLVGLPLIKLNQMMREAGINPLTS